MLGAIAGDIIGSIYEGRYIGTTDFPLLQPASTFTDDTVLTAAVTYAILEHRPYAAALKEIGRLYPFRGYGPLFSRWLFAENMGPYHSWGNGSAMRVSPVGHAWDDLEKVLKEAKESAAVPRDHPEGIKGAQAVAAAVFLARKGRSKDEIRHFTIQTFGYPLSAPLAEIRTPAGFEVSCQYTVPQAMTAFLESVDFEDAIRKAISLGGDSDTLACMTGAIAEAFYRSIPPIVETAVFQRLDARLAAITREFRARYPLSPP